MSLFTQTASRFARAQRTLARIQGATVDETGTNVIILGNAYLGVFGAAQMEDIAATGGGYRRVSVLPLTITRDQIETVIGMHKKELTRTDVSPALTYTMHSINDNDPHHWGFMLVRNGGPDV